LVQKALREVSKSAKEDGWNYSEVSENDLSPFRPLGGENVAKIDSLLTQNCRHIANAHMLPQVYELLEELGLPRLLICTPAEFLGDSTNAK
jgi:hypothetical protein